MEKSIEKNIQFDYNLIMGWWIGIAITTDCAHEIIPLGSDIGIWTYLLS